MEEGVVFEAGRVDSLGWSFGCGNDGGVSRRRLGSASEREGASWSDFENNERPNCADTFDFAFPEGGRDGAETGFTSYQLRCAVDVVSARVLSGLSGTVGCFMIHAHIICLYSGLR